MMSYWKRVDERLIKRGMLIMDLDFVGNYRDELVRELVSKLFKLLLSMVYYGVSWA
jgi:hypothetical protein